MTWALAVFVKPFVAVLAALGLRWCRQRFEVHVPDSRIKRLLLRPAFGSRQGQDRQETLGAVRDSTNPARLDRKP